MLSSETRLNIEKTKHDNMNEHKTIHEAMTHKSPNNA